MERFVKVYLNGTAANTESESETIILKVEDIISFAPINSSYYYTEITKVTFKGGGTYFLRGAPEDVAKRVGFPVFK